jgi:hypothetical protein
MLNTATLSHSSYMIIVRAKDAMLSRLAHESSKEKLVPTLEA